MTLRSPYDYQPEDRIGRTAPPTNPDNPFVDTDGDDVEDGDAGTPSQDADPAPGSPS